MDEIGEEDSNAVIKLINQQYRLYSCHKFLTLLFYRLTLIR